MKNVSQCLNIIVIIFMKSQINITDCFLFVHVVQISSLTTVTIEIFEKISENFLQRIHRHSPPMIGVTLKNAFKWRHIIRSRRAVCLEARYIILFRFR